MMMHALSTGGLTPVFSEKRNNFADSCADEHYHPNKCGLYELELRELQREDFSDEYDGKLIKVVAIDILRLPVHDPGYKVVLMTRNPEEIRQSFEAFTGYRGKMPHLQNYKFFISKTVKGLSNRKDILSINLIDYNEVVFSPHEYFEGLKDSGWPINVDNAASIVDKEQYRFRIERLTVGI